MRQAEDINKIMTVIPLYYAAPTKSSQRIMNKIIQQIIKLMIKKDNEPNDAEGQ